MLLTVLYALILKSSPMLLRFSPRQSRIDAPGALHHIRAGFRDGRVAELLDLKPEQVLARREI